jgi:hypothetical protein
MVKISIARINYLRKALGFKCALVKSLIERLIVNPDSIKVSNANPRNPDLNPFPHAVLIGDAVCVNG